MCTHTSGAELKQTWTHMTPCAKTCTQKAPEPRWVGAASAVSARLSLTLRNVCVSAEYLHHVILPCCVIAAFMPETCNVKC